MTKKQKKTLKRIIAAAVLTVLLALLFHFVELPWFVQLVLWLVPYLVIGHDVLRKAFMGIKNGEVFDENFLMAERLSRSRTQLQWRARVVFHEQLPPMSGVSDSQ